MSLVSVVIPAYNAASYVGGAIDSVLRQSHQDLEILVVDDGSEDNTEQSVQPYLSDPRIRYMRKENGGPSPAKNMGAMASKGEYLAFLDADDFLAPNAVEAMLRAFRETKAAWLNVGLLKITGKTRVVRHPSLPTGDPHLAILSDDFITRSPFYPREEFFAIGMFDNDIKGREDWDINVRMVLADRPLAVIDEPLYEYTRTEGSLTTGNRRSWHVNTEKLLRKHHKRMADAGNKEAGQIYARNMWQLSRLFYYELGDLRETVRCAWESLRYDKSAYRLVHPLIHKFTRKASQHGIARRENAVKAS